MQHVVDDVTGFIENGDDLHVVSVGFFHPFEVATS